MVDIARHVCVDEEGREWIPSSVAAALVPSSKPGKRTHISTLHRLREAGKIEGAKRPGFGRGWWFRVDQINALGTVRVMPSSGKEAPVEGVATLPQRRSTELAMADLAAHAGAGRKGA